MTESRISRRAVHSDPVTKACDLLEVLARHFSAENVDYECVERTNRFLVLHGGVWHAVTFSDTALMIKAVNELQEEISRAIRSCEYAGSEPLPGQ
jgi:hypothetical protein